MSGVIMSLKDIMVFADGSPAFARAFACAAALAQGHQAHLAVSLITTIPGVPMTFAGESYGELYAELAERARNDGLQQASALQSQLAALPRPGELRSVVVLDSEGPRMLAAHARHADMVLVGWPEDKDGRARVAPYLEAVMFQSGRPVLLIPEAYAGSSTGTRILVAWNASREATRAVHDALPLIETCKGVQVVVIDGKASDDGHGGDPGADIAVHLARHTGMVETRNVAGAGRRVAVIINDEARYCDADLIVMGGYGHSRAREWILGGATQDMLEICTLPILLSH